MSRINIETRLCQYNVHNRNYYYVSILDGCFTSISVNYFRHFRIIKLGYWGSYGVMVQAWLQTDCIERTAEQNSWHVRVMVYAWLQTAVMLKECWTKLTASLIIMNNHDFLNVSGIPQSDHYASKSAGYCLYIMLWDYNIIYMPMGSPQSEKPSPVQSRMSRK